MPRSGIDARYETSRSIVLDGDAEQFGYSCPSDTRMEPRDFSTRRNRIVRVRVSIVLALENPLCQGIAAKL